MPVRLPRSLPRAAVALLLALAAVPVAAAPDSPPEPPAHGRFDALLRRYVTDRGVDYARWARDEKDVQALQAYVEQLERVPVSALEETPDGRAHAMAYWIDLYNAATLRLVLDDYPVDSIRDLGSVFTSPWDRDVVTVEGSKLTLNAIENDVLRARFGDPRIHFALNCAARSCPPLRAEAYTGDGLDEQLEEQTRAFLHDPRAVRVEGDHYRLSRIFEWYRADFEKAAGSVGAFLRAYLAEDGVKLPKDDAKAAYFDYDWSLNDAEE